MRLLLTFAALSLVLPAQAQEDQYKRRGLNAMVLVAEGRADTAALALHRHLAELPGDPEFFYGLAVAHAQLGQPDSALHYVRRALANGLPASRFAAGPRRLLQPIADLPTYRALLDSALVEPVHGPLLGDVTDRQAAVWVRTSEEKAVAVRWWPVEAPDSVQTSASVQTDAAEDYTATVEIEGLRPNTAYAYEVLVGGTAAPRTWTFRTMPADGRPGRFTIAFGGCAGYTPWHERMWHTIAAQNPLAFLFLGDNVYIDHPTLPDVQRYVYYRRQSRPEYRTLTATTPIFAIWDDHDFGENDSFGGPEENPAPWREDVWRLYRQNWANPAYGGGEEAPGLWFNTRIADVEFFFLDGRYYRTPPGHATPTMLGEVQLDWLLSALRASTATFKVLVSPVPWAFGTKSGTQMTPLGRLPGAVDTWEGFPDERETIFSAIEADSISGVVLLSADRHRSDLWRIERPAGYDFYEFESGRLTNLHTHGCMPGALQCYNAEPSFGLLTFDTQRADPAVTYQVLNIDGELAYTFRVPLSELKQ